MKSTTTTQTMVHIIAYLGNGLSQDIYEIELQDVLELPGLDCPLPFLDM